MGHMTRRRKLALAGASGAAVVTAAALGAAGAVAASKVFSSSDDSKAVIDDAAAQLGVEPSALTDALRQALENRIDEAVESGRLTEGQAERAKERLGSGDLPLFFGLGGPRGHGFGWKHGGPMWHLGSLDAAASYLGLTEAELREALRDSTLAEIAEEQGKSRAGLVDALVAAKTQRIDEALADGKLTDEQAGRLKDGLRERVEALVDGELRRSHFGRHGFRPGLWGPRGPPAHRGPSG